MFWFHGTERHVSMQLEGLSMVVPWEGRGFSRAILTGEKGQECFPLPWHEWAFPCPLHEGYPRDCHACSVCCVADKSI